MLQAYIPQDNGRAKIGDVLYIGTPERCRELMDQLNTGELTQEAVKELYVKEQEQPEQKPTLNRNRHQSRSRNKNPCRSRKPPRSRKLLPTPNRRQPPQNPDGVAGKGAGNR